MTIASLLSKLPYVSFLKRTEAQSRRTARNLEAFLHHQAGLPSDYRVDTLTRRMPAVERRAVPIIKPGSYWWMEHAVYDGRPIVFQGRRLTYFCAQERYRTDSAMVVGIAESDSAAPIKPAPVIFPDRERHGIGIPAFTVFDGKVIAAYMDADGLEQDMIVASSDDGVSFEKQVIAEPFKTLDPTLKQIGLPWLLDDDGTLMVYFRGKGQGRSCLVRAELDLEELRLSNFEFHWCAENLINVAVAKKHDHYWLFYGATHGGGFYVKLSRDGINFSEQSVMLVDPADHGWDWDFGKIAASPGNRFEADSTICYLGTAGGKMAIGEARLELANILPVFEL